MTARKFNFFLLLLIITGVKLLPAQQPVLPEKIHLNAHGVINFKASAEAEAANPPAVKRRAIEQGEDIEKNFKFKPKPVPEGTPFYTVPLITEKSGGNSPAPTVSFNGIMDNGTLIPPDIRGAVGPEYVMQTTNQGFNIYTKSGILSSQLSINGFFYLTFGSGFFDPHVMYDPVYGRFVLCMDGEGSNGHGALFIGISQTSDPTGNWYIYSFDAAGNAADFIDYPLIGYNTNWVVLTCNDFINGSSPVKVKLFVLGRSGLYSGTEGTVSSFTDANAFTIAPAQTLDATQTTEYLVQDWNGNSGSRGYVEVGTITGTVASPVYSAGSLIGVTQDWNENAVNAKQSGTANTINTDDTRIGNAVYINGSLWFAHTVFLPASGAATYSGVDWWEINPASLAVQQIGRVYDATGKIFYYFPGININPIGDVLLSYSLSSSTMFAAAGYSFHAATDANNTMETNYTYQAGAAAYYKTYGSGRNRWGDYTYTAVDPADSSFWVFGEWANTSNNWATEIAHVPPSQALNCGTPTGLAASSITTSSATLSWTAVASATCYNIRYRIVGGLWTNVTASTNSYNLSGLILANYEWQVQAVCAAGNSIYCASAFFNTGLPNLTGGASTITLAPRGTAKPEPFDSAYGSLALLKLYPNPAQEIITIEYNVSNNSYAYIRLYDNTGRQVLINELQPQAGYNMAKLSTSQLANGSYILEIENNGESKRQSVVIMK
jgi:hypothetical protein